MSCVELLQVTSGIKDEVEKSHRALDSIVSTARLTCCQHAGLQALLTFCMISYHNKVRHFRGSQATPVVGPANKVQ